MASAEELCECEVLWPETAHDEGDDDDDDATPSCSSSPPVAMAPRSRTPAPAPRPRGGVPGSERPTTTTRAGSRPVDIQRPASSARRRGHEDRDRDWSAATMVPPHVLVSRRRQEAPCALLRPGARELSHLRDSVLRVTGFIEG